MSEPTVTCRIEFWEPIDDRRITPCNDDLTKATIIRVYVGSTEIEFLKERDPYMFENGYQLDRLRRLLQNAFEQGRGKQAALIHAALNPFG